MELILEVYQDEPLLYCLEYKGNITNSGYSVREVCEKYNVPGFVKVHDTVDELLIMNECNFIESDELRRVNWIERVRYFKNIAEGFKIIYTKSNFFPEISPEMFVWQDKVLKVLPPHRTLNFKTSDIADSWANAITHLAIVFIYIIGGERPYKYLHEDDKMREAIIEYNVRTKKDIIPKEINDIPSKLLLLSDEECTAISNLQNILRKCFDHDLSKRPSYQTFIGTLYSILKLKTILSPPDMYLDKIIHQKDNYVYYSAFCKGNEEVAMMMPRHGRKIYADESRVQHDKKCYLDMSEETAYHLGFVQLLDVNQYYHKLEAFEPFTFKRIKSYNKLTRVELCIDIAKGMNILHSAGKIYRFLDHENLVFNMDHELRLLPAMLLPFEEKTPSTFGRVELAYLPPEAVEDGLFNEYGNIYSLGCIMIAILTGTMPFSNVDDIETLKCDAYLDVTDAMPEELSYFSDIWPGEAVVSCIRKCLSVEYDDRPSVDQIIQALKSISSRS